MKTFEKLQLVKEFPNKYEKNEKFILKHFQEI